MVNIFLFIELLSDANAETVTTALEQLTMSDCEFAAVVKLSDQKIVAQLDCRSYADANTALLKKIAPVKGIVQTNIISAVRPTDG